MKSKKNRAEKQQKAQERRAGKIKKKVATTLHWSEIQDIRDKKITLKHGKKVYYVKGVKLLPINIFIATSQKQAAIINNMRIVWNQITVPVYWGFVFTPVDIDMYFAKLQEDIRHEEDLMIRNLMQSHYEKGCWFCDTHKEISFEFFVSGDDEKTLYKNYDKLVQEFCAGGFRLKEMSDKDYEDYIAYLYENDMINDYYFSRGIFRCLADENYAAQEAVMYEPEFEMNLLEDEVNEEDVKQLPSGATL